MVTKGMLFGFLIAMLILANNHLIFAQENNNVTKYEQELRDIIEQQNKNKNIIKFTDEAIFVSGAYPKPMVGSKERAANRQRSEAIAKSRPNEETKREIKRLVFSQGGDMAYEYGDYKISYDSPENKRTEINGSYLRVWRRIDGNWLVDVHFARHNQL